jgi:FAD:protein FMN transferase
MNPTAATEAKVYSKGIRLMGNHFEFSAVSFDEVKATECIERAIQEVRRLEQLLTTFDESSQTNRINAAAGIKAVCVDKEVFDLIDRSLKISALTQGAFDITYGSIDKSLWNFDTTMNALPDEAKAKSMVRLINYRNVILNRSEQTVYLKERGMRIGFGGIGKGYAADCAKAIMVKHGIKSGIVNAAGDLAVWGTQPSGQPWTIGVADPDRKNLPFATMTLSDMSVATSGNYEKYVIIGGRKYSHTIDPRTGYPVQGIKSVTIICRNAEIADAMATPVMVMGIKAGLHMINQVRDIACIVIDDNDIVHTSDNINIK